jgi:hypothetical protein
LSPLTDAAVLHQRELTWAQAVEVGSPVGSSALERAPPFSASQREHGVEEQIRDAILTELSRQSEDPECNFDFSHAGDRLTVSGEIDLDALVFVIVGSLAGGP